MNIGESIRPLESILPRDCSNPPNASSELKVHSLYQRTELADRMAGVISLKIKA